MLNWSWWSFLYSSSHVFLPPLLNIFCFCQVHTFSVLYWAHLCIKCSLGISNFLEEISSLSHWIVFLSPFVLIAEEGFLISPWYSFGTLHSNGYIFLFLLWFLLLFFSQLFVRPPQTAILLSCISLSWGWSQSLSPVQCYEPLSIVHQALCLSDLVPSIYFSHRSVIWKKNPRTLRFWVLDMIKRQEWGI